MTHSVLCTLAGFDGEARELLRGVGGTFEAVEPNALRDRIADATALIVGPDVRVDADMIAAATRLQVIATPATGTDNIDLVAAAERRIPVLSLRGDVEFLKGVTPTAELALGLVIDLLRRTHEAADAVRSGKWDRSAWMGRTLGGKTIGIVGLGRIGSMMARYCDALRMRVIYTDPAVSESAFERVSLETLLGQSDIVSLHVHLTPETEAMIDARRLAQFKPGAILINTARGRIVDEGAVIEALESRRMAGYAADVMARELAFEKGTADDPLIAYAVNHRNVILTPHIGGMAIEARIATDRRIAEAIVRTLRASPQVAGTT